MSTAREPCPNCQLPFYTDRNEHCPYCGSTPGTAEIAPAGSVRRGTPPNRERTTCPECGLDHYADVADCPYCANAVEHGSAGEDEAAASDHPDDGGTGSESGSVTVDTTPAGSVRRERPPSRPRTTCSQCGLDHYADDDGGCPYCSAAGAHGSEESTATAEPSPGTESEPAQPTAGSGGSDGPKTRQSGSSGGLLSRIMGIFGR